MGLFDTIKTVFSIGHPRHDAVEVDGATTIAALLAHDRQCMRDMLQGGTRRGWMDRWKEPRSL